MLMYTSKNTDRDMVRQVDVIKPVVRVAPDQLAANSDDFTKDEMQAKRLRRQRRMESVSSRSNIGWKVRAW